VCVAVGRRSWWVVVVWVGLVAGCWVVCVCVWCCGGGYTSHVAQVDCYCCHTKQCARCAPQAEKMLVYFFAVKHNEKAIDNNKLYIRYISNYIRLYTISDYVPSYPIIFIYHIPPYPTISHHIPPYQNRDIPQRYTPEAGGGLEQQRAQQRQQQQSTTPCTNSEQKQ